MDKIIKSLRDFWGKTRPFRMRAAKVLKKIKYVLYLVSGWAYRLRSVLLAIPVATAAVIMALWQIFSASCKTAAKAVPVRKYLCSPKNRVPFGKMREAIVKADAMGCVITLSWHMRNPVTGGSSWDLSGGNVVREVLPGGAAHELYKEWTDKCIAFLKSLKDAEGNPIPVAYRPYHENTGGAFWWGALSCEPEDYISLWKWTVEYMSAGDVHNLLYAYSTDIFKSEQEYMLRYPGDEWVDIMGWDAYHRPQEWDFLEGMTRMARTVSTLAAEHGKLAALTETGLESVHMDKWWTEYLLPSVRGYGLSWVLIWRNSQDMPDHFFAPFKGHKSEQDFRDMVSEEDILVLNDIN